MPPEPSAEAGSGDPSHLVAPEGAFLPGDIYPFPHSTYLADPEQAVSLARLLEPLVDAVIAFRYDSMEVRYWGPGAEKLYGWLPGEAMGRSIFDLHTWHDAERERLLQGLAREGHWQGEITLRGKHGQPVTVSQRVTAIPDEHGQPQVVLAIHLDITAQKAMEAQLLRRQRLESVGTLASGLAHDLNNVLSPVLMCAPLIASAELPPETRQTVSDTILAAARRGAAVVRQVLTFARGEEGGRLPVDCARELREVAAIARQIFPRNIQVSEVVPLGLWMGMGDPTHFHQVLLNLAINARDAMPEGGQLTLEAANVTVDAGFASMAPDASVGQYVMLAVADTGTGIPRELLERIFTPFFTTKEPGCGTGLGLSTALGLVRSHGGFMTVESTPGRGSAFRVYLPAVSAALAEEEPPPAPPEPGHGEIVLLAETEAEIRRTARCVLEQAGYRVLEAADGPEAIAVFAQNPGRIDIVITEVALPWLEGVALARALLNMQSELRIIMTCRPGEDSHPAEREPLGIDRLLVKPFDGFTLLRAVREALSGPPLPMV